MSKRSLLLIFLFFLQVTVGIKCSIPTFDSSEITKKTATDRTNHRKVARKWNHLCYVIHSSGIQSKNDVNSEWLVIFILNWEQKSFMGAPLTRIWLNSIFVACCLLLILILLLFLLFLLLIDFCGWFSRMSNECLAQKHHQDENCQRDIMWKMFCR